MFFLTALSHPRIKVNGEDPAETDVVIDSGSRLKLTCDGDAPVNIEPRLAKYKSHSKPNGNSCTLIVQKATYKLTGTFKCVYTDKNSYIFSSVYIFVRGEYRVYTWT